MENKFSLQTKYVTADNSKCRNCGWCRCRQSCPKKVIGKVGGFWSRRSAFIAPEDCNGCMKCTKTCIRKVFTKISDGTAVSPVVPEGTVVKAI